MANATIRLRMNLDSGKKDILIDYASDADAMPFEHEAVHRRLVEQLLGQGILSPDEVGTIRVTRGGAVSAPGGETALGPQGTKAGQGS